jgi:DNA-binding winged helix-turn-helix (wHTH) protein
VSLIHLKTQKIVSVNATSYLVSAEADGEIKELRLPPWGAEFLYALFKRHPHILSYPEILKIFQSHRLSITDTTCMHRKISEIRKTLTALGLDDLILNSRGIGYLLPLEFKNIDALQKRHKIEFRNKNVEEAVQKIELLVQSAIEVTSQCEIIQSPDGYIMNRNPVKEVIASNFDIFNKCVSSIIQEAQLHNADFMLLRLQYVLAKLKTYIGLARISEYSISPNQWQEWFKTEIYQTLGDVEMLLKSIFA